MIYLSEAVGDLTVKRGIGGERRTYGIKPTFNSIRIRSPEGERDVSFGDEGRILSDLRHGYIVETVAPLEDGGELRVRWEGTYLSSAEPRVIMRAISDMTPSGWYAPQGVRKVVDQIPHLTPPVLLINQRVMYPEELAGEEEPGFANWFLDEV